jgi:hypothetical protein
MGDLLSAGWEAVITFLQLRHDEQLEAEPEADDHAVERRARVQSLRGRVATIRYEDGGTATVEVPERMGVQIGTAVRVVEHDDGRVAYLWG